MGAALFGLLPQMSYDVMRSTKKLEGLLNLIRAGAGEDGIYALAAAARSPRSEGSTRGGGSRSEQKTDVIGHSSGRRTALVYGGVYTWRDERALRAYQATELFQNVIQNPHLDNITVREFSVLEAPTRVTSGVPIASAV